jgi:5-(carboxyamino)imidazole ribonucleotide synthase
MAALPLGATIGILGDGQLGRMLSQAASRLGFRVAIYGPDADSPAAGVSAVSVVGGYRDEAALKAFADQCDVITLEFENIPVETIDFLTGIGKVVAPSSRALGITQDRVREKTFARKTGVATVDFAEIDSEADIAPALLRLGAPALLKTRREGYDGKGQVWVNSAEDAASAWTAIGAKPAILEARADFDREISVVAARGFDGEVKAFPIGENHHVGGILATTTAPADLSAERHEAAHDIARKVLDGLDYVGVLAVELFVLRSGGVLLNEIAPRVHNSGHWTQEGCVCDQFEQHVRAVAGWPLGDVTARCRVEMTNLLGDDILNWRELAAESGARLHVYGKALPRPGRKMGHINRILS